MLGTAVFDDLPAGHRLKEKKTGVAIQRGANHKWHDGSRKIKLHQNARELHNTVDRVRRNCETHSSKGSRWACNHGIDTSKVMVVAENWTHEDIWDVGCLHDTGK